MTRAQATDATDVTTTFHRVDYSETDQMGVVYHARYLVWLDVARTEHLRRSGTSYRDLEATGLRLAVSEASLRYRRPARYDDPVRVRTWVRDVASRRIEFGYAVEHDERGELLVTASTALLVLTSDFTFSRLPEAVARRLHPVPDLVRL
jgi:acyl-CoA thioester hydrolase